MNEFTFGFFHPFRCIGMFFKHPKLIMYSIVPMVINLVIYGTIFFYVYGTVTDLTSDLEFLSRQDSLFLESLKVLMKIAAFLLVLIVCYFLFIIFGGIVSAPFNEVISKYVEEKIYKTIAGNQLPFFRDIYVSIREELKKLLFYFTVMIPLFAIGFIPMIGSVVTIAVGMPFSFYYNALDFLDYPMTRTGTGFRNKLKVINGKLMLSMGFGAIAFLLTFLPVINVFFKPLLVVSGTSIFYVKKYDQQLNEKI